MSASLVESGSKALLSGSMLETAPTATRDGCAMSPERFVWLVTGLTVFLVLFAIATILR
jgi:hypothetical protein